MKKIILILLALTLSFSLFACGNDDVCTNHADEDTDGKCDVCGAAVESEDGTSPDDKDSAIALIKDGKINFQFVRASNSGGSVMMMLNTLKMTVESLGGTLDIVDDKVGNEKDIEILIGDVTSRGEKYIYDKYSLGLKGYVIKAIDNKIIVTAGSQDTLVDAVETLIDDIIGIKSSTKVLADVTMTSENEVLKIQDDYRITSIKVNGEEINGYTIAYDKSNEAHATAASSMNKFLYEKAGYYLPLVDITEAGKSIIIANVSDAGPDGFRVKIDENGALRIECAYANAFETAFSSFFNNEIRIKEGDINFTSSYEYTELVSVVYYEDFGAKGDGYTDDYKAIKAAHDYANIGGQTVKAKNNKTYYIENVTNEASRGRPVIIKTNVDWGTAKFIIDDTGMTNSTDQNNANIFNVVSDYETITLSEEEVAKMFPNGIDASTLTKIDWKYGYAAILVAINDNHYNYIRYGGDANDGFPQKELIIIDKEGNIDPSTKYLLDYEEVTTVTFRCIEDDPITISGGIFTTKANRIANTDETGNYRRTYYKRGIFIERSNVVLEGIEHYVTGELENLPTDPVKGPSYRGFYSAGMANNILIQNCVLTARRYYRISGTYDFAAEVTNNIYLKNCTQSNYYLTDENGVLTDKPSMTNNMYWGVGGTNWCKNMVYDGCELTRYDAHSGLYNGKIINSKITAIQLIGGGDMLIENCVIEPLASDIVTLRFDYGSTWKGTITIKDSKIKNLNTSMNLLAMPLVNHDFGYTVHTPNLIIDNLTFTNPVNEIMILKETANAGYYTMLTESNIQEEFLSNGVRNINKIAAPEFITLINPNGYNYTLVDVPFFDYTKVSANIVRKTK